VAEDEARKISERTKAALAAAKARGVKLGGYHANSPDIRLHQVAGVAAAAKKAATYADLVRPLVEGLKAEGRSLRAIADELDRLGIPSARGGKWGKQAVSNVLSRG
jgi:DNA invertase Pin-like site-specific DNA recombinase